jgi:TATA-box binding protein (TBP) (component of TFIID and TFIIIB)
MSCVKLEMSDNIFFSPYRISTITCNADIGNNINLNLSILFEYIHIIENTEDIQGIIWAQYLKEEAEINKGFYPKKRRKSKKNILKKNRFDNQITIIFRINDKYLPNIKIFKNGNIQLTGIKNEKDTELIANHIICQIKDIYEVNKKIIVDYHDEYRLILEYQNFKIRMINTDFKIYCDENLQEHFEIKRKEIHKIFISDRYKNKCSFQPGIYQGVKLEYFWNKHDDIKNGICKCPNHCYGKGNGLTVGNCKKVTGALFESGSVLITGGITFEQVLDTYNYICKFLEENKNTIKKPKPNIANLHIINDN